MFMTSSLSALLNCYEKGGHLAMLPPIYHCIFHVKMVADTELYTEISAVSEIKQTPRISNGVHLSGGASRFYALFPFQSRLQ